MEEKKIGLKLTELPSIFPQKKLHSRVIDVILIFRHCSPHYSTKNVKCPRYHWPLAEWLLKHSSLMMSVYDSVSLMMCHSVQSLSQHVKPNVQLQSVNKTINLPLIQQSACKISSHLYILQISWQRLPVIVQGSQKMSVRQSILK